MHNLTEDGKVKLRYVANFLAENPARFNMNRVFGTLDGCIVRPYQFDLNDCGTTMCIAGAVEAFFDPELKTRQYFTDAAENAMMILSGEYDRDLDRLFMAFTDEKKGQKGLDSTNVIQAIEIFIESGIEGVEDFLETKIPDGYIGSVTES